MKGIIKAGLVVLLIGLLFIAYNSCGGHKKKRVDTGNSAGTVVVIGETYQQTSDNTIVPLGGATVTAEYLQTSPGGTLTFTGLLKAAEKKTASAKSNSDGSYTLPDIPANTVVTVTITSADTTKSIEIIDTTTNSNSSAILKGKGKKIGLIKQSQDSVLNTFDDTTLPRCQITVPSGAVSQDVDNIYLTPTHQGENLAPLPDGYGFIAGAEFSGTAEITFASGKEAAPYIILPSHIRAEELSSADIKLMEFVNGSWVITTPAGKGKAYTTGNWLGYIGPDDTTPAKLKGVNSWCWAVAVAGGTATVSGTVKDSSGTAIQNAMVFGGGSKTHSKSDGAYTLKNVAVLKSNTLIPINAVKDGYQLASQFASVSPGATVSNIDFVLQAVSQTGEIYGTVTNAADSSPILGAIVTLATQPAIRGMKYDNKNTPTDLTDDTFYVIPPPGVTITQLKWMLTLPAGTVFTSLIENGASVVLHQLATEATNSGYSLATGAYKVELEVTYSGGKKALVSGGFLLKQSGLILYIADVKLPIALADQLVLKAVTDSAGGYRFVDVPTSEQFYGSAAAIGFIGSNTVQITALTAGEQRQQNFTLAPITTDTTPPTQPTNLTATANDPYSVLLTWGASTDNSGIDYYQVYRNGIGVGKTTGTAYLDNGLTPNTLYTYTIGAVDKANNPVLSGSANVTTPALVIDTTAPSTPTGLAIMVIGPSQINLSWSASTDDVGVAGYQVYRNGALCSTLNATSYADTGLAANTLYTYYVIAYDAAGNTSAQSSAASATTAATADTTAPAAPASLTATAVSSGQINLAWSASTDNVGVTGYKVYRSTDGTNYALRSTLNATTSYSDSGLSASTTYWYKVCALDAAGNTSGYSSVASATTLPFVDITAPTAPTGLTSSVYTSTWATLVWNASTDNVGVTGYKLYRDGVIIGNTNGTNYTNTGLMPSTPYTYTVTAYDAAGNNSTQSTAYNLTTPGDSVAPSIPAGLVATAVSSASISLWWNASTDNVGVTGYKIYRDAAYIVSVAGTSYTDTGLAGSTLYSYTVAAYDAASNTSAQSGSASATTPAATDTTAPTVPSGLTPTGMSCVQIDFTWNASTDAVGVTGYKVYRNTVYVNSVAGISYSDIGLTPSTTYTYTVAAYDAAGNISAQSIPMFPITTLADTTAPSVPAGLTGTAVSTSQINISWSASTDNVGVTGYKVYRDGVEVQNTNSTNYANTGLIPGTTYAYTVLAYDAAGNPSAQCTAVNITTHQGNAVAWWKFDETSGTTAGDASGNGNNGTVYGPAWSGSALSFDGVDDYVAIPQSASLSITGTITVQAWVKVVGGSGERDIISSHSGYYGVELDVGDSNYGSPALGETKVLFYPSDGTSWNEVASPNSLTVGQWYHIVGVNVEGSYRKIYINGVEVASAPGVSFKSATLGFHIGNNAGGGQYFNGLIDDVRIYNYARTATDIQAEYNTGVWTKSASNPVLPLGANGTWDDYDVFAPTVILDSGVYKMWYTGSDGSNFRIGYATSSDGITWTKSGSNPVLNIGTGWEGAHVYHPCVIKDTDGTYKMWYTGHSGSATKIGYATSSDGINWTKYGSNPVLTTGSGWESVNVYVPTVIKDGTTYKMWYSGYNGSNARIGYATSTDGITWTKSGSNPVLSIGAGWESVHVNSPSVILDNGVYKMWYHGSDGTNSRAGYATSADGINWTKSAYNPVLNLGATGAWDDATVGEVAVIYTGGVYKMWYAGSDGTNQRIGYAQMGQ